MKNTTLTLYYGASADPISKQLESARLKEWRKIRRKMRKRNKLNKLLNEQNKNNKLKAQIILDDWIGKSYNES